MNQNERMDGALGDEPGGNHRFSERRGRRQHARLVSQQRLGGDLLFRSQFASKGHIQGFPRKSFIPDTTINFERQEQFPHLVQATSRKTEMLRMVLGASDHPRFVIRRQPHRLCAVELRILKRGQAQ